MKKISNVSACFLLCLGRYPSSLFLWSLQPNECFNFTWTKRKIIEWYLWLLSLGNIFTTFFLLLKFWTAEFLPTLVNTFLNHTHHTQKEWWALFQPTSLLSDTRRNSVKKRLDSLIYQQNTDEVAQIFLFEEVTTFSPTSFSNFFPCHKILTQTHFWHTTFFPLTVLTLIKLFSITLNSGIQETRPKI